jgi:hypothetical protein
MANILFAHADLSDSAVFSATTENASYPLVNLQNIQPSIVYRSTSVAAHDLDVDLGAMVAVNFFALVKCNFTTSASIRVRTADSQSNLSASPSYDSTALGFTPPADYNNRGFYHYKSSPVTARWVRFTISDVGNADGYLEIGRLIVADAFVPSRNFDYGNGVGFIDPSTTNDSLGAPIYVNERRRRKYLEYTGNFTKSEALGNVYNLDFRRGSAKDYLIILDVDDTTYIHQQSIYGLVKELTSIERAAFPLFKKRYRIEEML